MQKKEKNLGKTLQENTFLCTVLSPSMNTELKPPNVNWNTISKTDYNVPHPNQNKTVSKNGE